MTTHITIRSWGALLLGVFFTAVTARTVLDDLWLGTSPLTVAHLQTIAALVAALASGHFIVPMVRQARVAVVLGLITVFVASTGLVIFKAAVRNAEVAQTKVAAIESTNEAREAAQHELDRAEAEEAQAKTQAETAKAAAAKECASGKGRKCDGRVETRETAIRELDKAHGYTILVRARLDVLKPAVDPHSGYRSAALLAETFGIAKADGLQPRLELVVPFLQVIIAELATLLFLGMALGHRSATVETANVERSATAIEKPAAIVGEQSDIVGQTDFPAISNGSATTVAQLFSNVVEFPNGSPNGPKGGRKASPRKGDVLADIVRRIENGERFDSQEELRGALSERFGPISKSTLSNWLDELTVSRTQFGRRKKVG